MGESPTQATEDSKLDDIYERYVSRGLRVVKWGSEYRLYSLVKSFLPKAVFQYRPEWLEGQSFDIYLPDYNIAIEYQGKQHYEALDYFGGEPGYLDNLQRDQKKRVLSKQYNVDVLEWKYDSRMSRESVRQFLLKAGIDVLLIE